MPAPNSVLALDVGDKRVGVAAASWVARLPRPLTTLQRGENFFEALKELIRTESASALVVGLPRGLEGQSTLQTQATEEFIMELEKSIGLPVYRQDEALTSNQAEVELSARNPDFKKEDTDALAATYILEDFLAGYNKNAGAEAL
jgi:putative Holliday junction resolvase